MRMSVRFFYWTDTDDYEGTTSKSEVSGPIVKSDKTRHKDEVNNVI